MIGALLAARLNKVALRPQKQWEEYGMNNRCVKSGSPSANFAGRILRDIVAAHATMDKKMRPRQGRSPSAGLWPHVFIVVTNEDIKDHGLLLVYAFDPIPDEDEDEGDREREISGEPNEEDE